MMFESQNRKVVAGLAIAALLAVVAGGFLLWRRGAVQSPSPDNGLTETPVVNPNLRPEYREAMHAALAKFSQALQTGDSQRKESAARAFIDEAVDIIVPTEEKDFHLSVVLAAAAISRGEIDQGEAKFTSVVAAKDWAKDTVTP